MIKMPLYKYQYAPPSSVTPLTGWVRQSNSGSAFQNKLIFTQV